MAGTAPIRLAGPAFLAAAATNIYTPAASPIVSVITKIRVHNQTAGAATFTLYVGATGASVAGTEYVKDFSLGVKGSSSAEFERFGSLKMLSTDFLVGIASGATTLVIVVEGYQYVGI